MDKYIFKFNSEQSNTAGVTEFAQFSGNGQNNVDANPLKEYFFGAPNVSHVTSIPTPYARMHLTEIAIREHNYNKQQNNNRTLNGDYLKAVSHCLDIFELFFHFDDLNLRDKGITVERYEAITETNNDHNDFLSKKENENIRKFVATLDLFRRRYVDDIRDKMRRNNVENYFFDFSQMYVFKCDGKTFAGTSPFTGFFAKTDCDLSDIDLTVPSSNGQHRLLTNNSVHWLSIEGRSASFKKFLFLLLRDSQLSSIFVHLFDMVKREVDVNGLRNVRFDDEYKEYNLTHVENYLLKIAAQENNNETPYIRIDGIDRCYLKYLLFVQPTQTPIDLNIHEGDYLENTALRLFAGQQMQWLAVKDILADALFVLPYDIDNTYRAASYKVMAEDGTINNANRRRCLLPIKREAMKYLNMDRLEDNLDIIKYPDGHYVVKLKIDLSTGGTTILRRDYYDLDDTPQCTFPNGVLKDMQNGDCHFAFGIYPFVKSVEYENIYKILFYHDFTYKTKLSFFYQYPNQNGQRQIEYSADRGEVIDNLTHQADPHILNVNTQYYQVKTDFVYGQQHHHVGLDIVELSVDFIQNPQSGNPTTINGRALILPQYHIPVLNPGDTVISVDMGTSNTFVAYKHGNDIVEIDTHHTEADGSEWNELALLHKPLVREDVLNERTIDVKDLPDLVLRTSDEPKRVDDTCLSSQMFEFIPSRIAPGQKYQFPIPTAINRLLVDGQNVPDAKRYAMINESIPFAYYNIPTRGQRDNIKNNFKWFYTKNNNGGYGFNTDEQANFNAFLDELLFIIRSHMLCNGYPLNDCKLIWTYPLSFSDPLIQQYKRAWNLAFCKYWAPQNIQNNNLIQGPQVTTTGGLVSLDSVVKYTNESRSPVYECMTNPALAGCLTILMDIGGGSTDIIGYLQNAPQFVTSFGFAGNSLYLCGNLNDSISQDGTRTYTYGEEQLNYIKRIISTQEKVVLGNESSFNLSEPLNTLMNYGFAKRPTEFNTLFRDNGYIQFMLQFHNSALFYHTAQMSHIYNPDVIPHTIFLTGNGSLLFQLNRNQGLAQAMFSKVYGRDCSNIKIEYCPNPKKATSYGAIKGNSLGLAFNDDSQQIQGRMVGDADHYIVITNQNQGTDLSKGFDREAVRQNVYNFIDAFYEVCLPADQMLSKDDVLGCAELVNNDARLQFDQNLSDSLFFTWISLFMQQMSVIISGRIR